MKINRAVKRDIITLHPSHRHTKFSLSFCTCTCCDRMCSTSSSLLSRDNLHWCQLHRCSSWEEEPFDWFVLFEENKLGWTQVGFAHESGSVEWLLLSLKEMIPSLSAEHTELSPDCSQAEEEMQFWFSALWNDDETLLEFGTELFWR